LIEPIGKVLVKVPFAVAVTFAVTVQKLAAGIVPPENASDPAPATAVIVAPAHVVDAAGGLARVIAAGKLSVKEAPVKSIAFALLSRIVIVETPAEGIGEGENDFVPVGLVTAETESVALAGVPLVSPSFVTSAPVGIVSMWLPTTVDVTSAWNVQLPGVEPTWAGIVAPEIPTVFPPATAETTPPAQVVDAFGGVSTKTPAGSESVTIAPVSGVNASLKKKTVSVDVPP
jgi:hypothetical protein